MTGICYLSTQRAVSSQRRVRTVGLAVAFAGGRSRLSVVTFGPLLAPADFEKNLSEDED